jgi:hypothetical protein
MWEGGKSVTQVTKGSLEKDLYEQQMLMQENPELNNVQEVEDPEEEMMDYSKEAAEMAYSNLMAIKRNALMIEALVNSSEEVKMELGESWLGGKLVICDDYLNSVAKYLSSEQE